MQIFETIKENRFRTALFIFLVAYTLFIAFFYISRTQALSSVKSMRKFYDTTKHVEIEIHKDSVMTQTMTSFNKENPSLKTVKLFGRGHFKASVDFALLDTSGNVLTRSQKDISMKSRRLTYVIFPLDTILKRPYPKQATMKFTFRNFEGTLSLLTNHRVRKGSNLHINKAPVEGLELIYGYDFFNGTKDYISILFTRLSQYKPSFYKTPTLYFIAVLYMAAIVAFMILIPWLLTFRTAWPGISTSLFFISTLLLFYYDLKMNFWFNKVALYYYLVR